MTTSVQPAAASAWWHWWLPGLLALAATLGGFGPLQRLDLLAFDLLSSLAPSSGQAPGAVVVAIDERSLQQLGRWPWSRGTHAQLLDRLHDAPPKAIAFAILFDVPDALDMGGDSAFAAAIGRSGRVVLSVAPVADGNGAGLRAALPAPALSTPRCRQSAHRSCGAGGRRSRVPRWGGWPRSRPVRGCGSSLRGGRR